jgi:6-phosphofructokinase 1
MNVVVGQSGGPTAVINAPLAGVYEAAIKAGADKVYGMQNGVQGFMQERLILLNDVLNSTEKVELLKRTPACFLGSCRYKLKSADDNAQDYEKIFSVLEKYAIDWFFYIGGNDSMDSICKLAAYGKKIGSKIRFIGVPKTVDNDLMVTDHTPGYGSAAKFVATTMKEIVCDARIYERTSVTIVEIMGRNAGWLTAACALAKGEDCEGVDMICLPEIPMTLEEFLRRVADKLKTKQSLVIAVSEGLKLPDGRYICELSDCSQKDDVFGHKQLTGTALFLANECTKQLGVKARAIELSTLQRCAAHLQSATDVAESYAVGAAAVQVAAEGDSGVATTFVRVSNQPYRCETGKIEIAKMANFEKKVPVSWIDAENMQLRAPFIEYALPLIQGEVQPFYKDGLPQHILMKK